MASDSASGTRIFISHSAKEEHASQALVALEQALTALQYDVLLDKTRLQPGNIWRQDLYNWMCSCHAAVILFSEAALTSDWVFLEATILSLRRQDNQFALIPIFLGDVETALRQSRFCHLALTDIQGISRRDAEDTVRLLIELLEPLKRRQRGWNRSELLEQELAHILRRNEVSKEGLDQLCLAFSMSCPHWAPSADAFAITARRMLQTEFEAAIGCLLSLGRILSPKAQLEILGLLAPGWVDPRPAVRIQQISEVREGTRTVGVNGSLVDFTGNMYVRRASFGDPAWRVITAHSCLGEDPAASLIDEIWTTLRRTLAIEGSDDEETAEELEQVIQKGDRFFVQFAPPIPDREVLRRLREAFPQLVFVVLAGDERPLPEIAEPWGIEFLEPQLESRRERSAHRIYSRALNDLKQRV